MGGLFGGDGGGHQITESADSLFQQAQMGNLLQNADMWLSDGGMGESTSYMGDLNAMMGQMGEGYMGMISGEGSADRYAALQAANAASAEQAANALGGELASIGLDAGGSGTANSSRRGVAEGVATAAANRDLASQQAAANQQFLQNEEALKQQGLAGMGNLFTQAGQLHEMAKNETAGAKQLQNLLAYQGLISGNMGGTTSSITHDGGTSQMNNVFGGMAMGAGAGMQMSDKRLKKKIKKVKTRNGKKIKTKDGVDVATWEWNKKAEKEYGLKGKDIGVIAQDVEKKRPSAVKKNKKGMRAVDYGALM